MTIENANDHPFKVAIVKDADLFANSHPFKVYIEGGGSGAEARVVDELPEEGESGYIYLVLKEQTEEGDIYDEYIWALQSDGETYGWEHLGATSEVTIVLYDSLGNNTDGAMTQKAVTESLYADGASKTQIQLGNSVSSGANSSVAIGKDMIASGSRSIAIGERTDSTVTTASGASSVSIGVNTAGTGANGVAIGVRAKATGSGAVALGTYPEASGDYSFAMHYMAVASGESSIAIGMQSQATRQDSIGLGVNTKATGLQGIAVGRVSEATGEYSVSLGQRAKARGDVSLAVGPDAISEGDRGIAIGSSAQANAAGSVAIGARSRATVAGEMNIGSTVTSYGYNNSNYRLLTGLYDGQSAHDAATYGQVISYSAINGAGAPTTATEGKYVGQLYYDTTNEAMYFLKAIDTTTDPDTYTWKSLGGGGSITPVQTAGTSTTDVMSQNATTSMVFADPATQYKIKIGAGASSSEGTNAVEIGRNSSATGESAVAIGANASANTSSIAIGGNVNAPYAPKAMSADSIAIGNAAKVDSGCNMGVAIGSGAHSTAQGQMDIGIDAVFGNVGYNNSAYRLLTGLYDGQSAHDAVTVEQVNSVIDSINTALSTNIPHIGA